MLNDFLLNLLLQSLLDLISFVALNLNEDCLRFEFTEFSEKGITEKVVLNLYW